MLVIRGLFQECSKFNQDISEWDINNVENILDIIKECYELEKFTLKKWDYKLHNLKFNKLNKWRTYK